MVVQLNPAQQTAVEHEHGPLLVLAGAGSGKTRVITHRIARLLESGCRPEAILAMTFTNKAAAEMRDRLAPMVGAEVAKRIWLSTFHSFGVRFLGEERDALGYAGRFVIFDQGDCLGLIREFLRRRQERKLDPMAIITRISLWKNRFLAATDLPESDFEYDAVARELYPEYEEALRSMCAVDFDDLVVAPAKILRGREELRAKWQQRFRYILVDEFQDTNAAQFEVLKLLVNGLRNVCVVGDDDQAIYGWRGADVGNIIDFDRHFPGTLVVKLEENYRSRKPILDLANAVIGGSDKKKHRKTLVSMRGEGPKVRRMETADSATEAKAITMEIRKHLEQGVKAAEIALLYRSAGTSRLLEEELRLAGIPYQLYGGTQFFDRKEVKDALAYLRAAVHPQDELSLRRILNHPPRGIGATTVKRLERYALANEISFANALAAAPSMNDLPEPARRGIMALQETLRETRGRFQRGEDLASAARDLFTRTGLEREVRAQDAEGTPRRWGNIESLLRSLNRYQNTPQATRPTLAQFLIRIGLRFDQEEETRGNRVTLSTLHAAKGLEFDVVFLVGCIEGQLPHNRSLEPKVTEAAPSDVSEERRLFYVGITRAREVLYLTLVKQKMLRGKTGPVTPTRFLDGIPEGLIETISTDVKKELDRQETAAAAQAIVDLLSR